jgi:hypothetical protein
VSSPISPSSAVEPVAPGPSRARLADLELKLAERERELATISAELQELQRRYLGAVGGFYADLADLEAASVAIEIRLGLRTPKDEADAEDERAAASDTGDGCGNQAAPSSDLKKIFRSLARSIHPDLALDEPARWRRHSLMAEANRAYAEQDEDRLRLILAAWERSPDSLLGLEVEADDERIARRIAAIETRLLQIDSELGDLARSAISQLKQKMDDARRQGWDLLAEMVLEVKRETGRARARLASLERAEREGRWR